MSLPTVTFVSQVVPEKKLSKVMTLKYHPTPEMKNQIISDIEKHGNVKVDEYVVEIDVIVKLKQYDDSKYYYDTKNTRV